MVAERLYFTRSTMVQRQLVSCPRQAVCSYTGMALTAGNMRRCRSLPGKSTYCDLTWSFRRLHARHFHGCERRCSVLASDKRMRTVACVATTMYRARGFVHSHACLKTSLASAGRRTLSWALGDYLVMTGQKGTRFRYSIINCIVIIRGGIRHSQKPGTQRYD